jgi:hypothetical protein
MGSSEVNAQIEVVLAADSAEEAVLGNPRGTLLGCDLIGGSET